MSFKMSELCVPYDQPCCKLMVSLELRYAQGESVTMMKEEKKKKKFRTSMSERDE